MFYISRVIILNLNKNYKFLSTRCSIITS